jgi:hypothetical protein
MFEMVSKKKIKRIKNIMRLYAVTHVACKKSAAQQIMRYGDILCFAEGITQKLCPLLHFSLRFVSVQVHAERTDLAAHGAIEFSEFPY